MDNEFDQQVLNAFLDALFTAKSYDLDFCLATDDDGSKGKLVIPDGRSHADFLRWVETLPDTLGPHVLVCAHPKR